MMRPAAVVVVLVGDSGVGKTALARRLQKGLFDPKLCSPSVGVNFETAKPPSAKGVTLHLWDTAGQERYRSLTRSYYRRADVVLLCRTNASPDSARNAEGRWLEEVTAHGAPHTQVLRVLTKADLDLEVVGGRPTPLPAGTLRVSALSGAGCDQLLEAVVRAGRRAHAAAADGGDPRRSLPAPEPTTSTNSVCCVIS